MRNRLFVSLENEQQDLIEATPLEETQLEAEEAVVEVAEDQAEIEELQDGADSAMADAETLELIHDTMEESLEEGDGISEDAAKIAEIAVESIGRRLGVNLSGTFPAMESFGGSNSRRHATRMSLEAIGDTIKRIWEAVKNGFKLIWQKIKDFFTRFFTNVEKVRKAAESLRKKVRDRSNWKADQKDVKVSSSTINSLSDDGKYQAQSVAAMVANHRGATEGIRGFITGLSGSIDTVKGAIEEAAKSGGKDTGTASKVQDTLTNAEKALFGKIGGADAKDHAVKEEGPVTNSSAKGYGPFVGGDLIVVKQYQRSGIGMMEVSLEEGKKNTANVLPALEADAVVDACNTVIDLMKVTEDYQKVQSDIEKLNKNVLTLADNAMKVVNTAADAASDGGGDFAKQMNSLGATVNKIGSVSTRIVTMLPSWNVRLGNALLKYASASYSNLKEG